MNNNLFFNNGDSLIEPILPSNGNNLDTNSFTKQDLSFTNSFLTQRPSLPQQPISNTQTIQPSRAYQPPTIAPYPTTQNIFNNNNRFDISIPNNATTPPKTVTNSPNITIKNKPSPINNQATSITALSNQVSPIMNLSKQPSPITSNTLHKPSSPHHFNTNNNKQISPTIHPTATHINTPNSIISSPTNYTNLQFSDIVQSSSPTTSTSTTLSPPPAPVAPPIVKKSSVPKLTITGDNVNSDNIEEGYVQFVLNHDPNYISDGIESLVYAKRKFLSVPKTGDLSYTTWDIYELVLKLHRREVKI